jgi:hypothetical protein
VGGVKTRTKAEDEAEQQLVQKVAEWSRTTSDSESKATYESSARDIAEWAKREREEDTREEDI